MAAYAALVSLMHLIDQIQLHPRPPISLDKEQVESLTEKVTFLQEFLEVYSHIGDTKDADDALESRIADVAYAAEDVIESQVVNQILPKSTNDDPKSTNDDHVEKIGCFNCFQGPKKATSHTKMISSTDHLYQGLQKVIQDMDLFKKEATKIKEKKRVQDYQLHRDLAPAGSSRFSSAGQSTMVGFDDVLLEVMGKLTRGQFDLQFIPIVGMGGIGKTTLATNIYQNQAVVQHFDILAWVTISQEYRIREILIKLLQEDEPNLTQMEDYELGDKLHKRLSGRRYLIIMDDIWDVEVWDQLKLFLPNNKNGSRILLTTRLSNLSSYVAHSDIIKMGFLDEKNSWNLFSQTMFGKQGCPLELEEIGKKIVRNCRGLPLSIVVIVGLLAKSKHEKQYWEHIAENLNSIVNLEDDEHCLKILRMSYNHLPIYLKPCFLYMGVFKEDSKIHVSMLMKLWVTEGFLKPASGKNLEETAKVYLEELINRNVVLVHELGSTGNIKYCKIHDLLRDLCLREAQKERFYNVLRPHSFNVPQGTIAQRRIVIPNNISEEKVLDAVQSMSLSRSLVCGIEGLLPHLNFRLLRILEAQSTGGYFLEDIFQLVNSRYIAVNANSDSNFPSSINLLWNLHTLIVKNIAGFPHAPTEIWNMPQLRHVEVGRGFHLPNPPNGYVGRQDDLGNLQTLTQVFSFKCSEEVVKRIPNIKKLKIGYWGNENVSEHCLNY